MTVDGQAQGHGSGENTCSSRAGSITTLLIFRLDTEDDDLDSSEMYRLSNLDASRHLVEVKQRPIEQSTDLNTTVPFLFLNYVEIEYSINSELIYTIALFDLIQTQLASHSCNPSLRSCDQVIQCRSRG